MRVVRALLIVAVLFVAGCGGGEPAAESSSSPETSAAEPTEASEEPTEEATEEPTEEATEEPTETAAAEVEPAKELLIPLAGYKYGPLPKGATQGLEQALGGPQVEEIIGDFESKAVKKGGKPVAVVFSIRFTAEATDKDKTDFVAGVAQSSGAQPNPVTIAGEEVLFIKAATPVFLVGGEDYALLLFGQNRKTVEPVVAALVKGLK